MYLFWRAISFFGAASDEGRVERRVRRVKMFVVVKIYILSEERWFEEWYFLCVKYDG